MLLWLLLAPVLHEQRAELLLVNLADFADRSEVRLHIVRNPPETPRPPGLPALCHAMSTPRCSARTPATRPSCRSDRGAGLVRLSTESHYRCRSKTPQICGSKSPHPALVPARPLEAWPGRHPDARLVRVRECALFGVVEHACSALRSTTAGPSSAMPRNARRLSETRAPGPARSMRSSYSEPPRGVATTTPCSASKGDRRGASRSAAAPRTAAKRTDGPGPRTRAYGTRRHCGIGREPDACRLSSRASVNRAP